MIDQTWTIEKIVKEAPPMGWEDVFKDALPELVHISKKLDKEAVFGHYYPPKKDLFNSFLYCPLSTVKVVILNDQPTAKDVGMPFSLQPHDELTQSIKNIYQELSNEYESFDSPTHGDLRSWCQQDVMLLNKCLTGGKVSHLKWDLWLGFLNKVFKAIHKVNPYCLFLLWHCKWPNHFGCY